ncbi:MAG: hypothetical protein NTW59_01590 [Candidatus Diapherotrites archaeon]|nr:hypothetical protein [Candidatus Diapherotrites archaeon]
MEIARRRITGKHPLLANARLCSRRNKKCLAGMRGQAALSDSLYFLLIVSGLCAFLFFFAANYGLVVEQQVVRQYRSEYATASLETILYSSTPRDPSKALDQAEEVDYLLAAVKEDYADDQVLDDTNAILTEGIKTIMEPFADNSDYMFFIYMPEKKKFVYNLFFVTEFEVSGKEVTQTRKATLLCNPKSLDDVEETITGVGAIAQSNSSMQMIEIAEGGAEKYPPAQVNLTMWVPTEIDWSKLNCKEYNPPGTT